MNEKSSIPWKRSRRSHGPDIDLPSLDELQHNLNQFFETMWNKIGRQHRGVSGQAAQQPASDMGESTDMLEIMIELPGVSEDDIEILVSDDSISVSGEKKFERDTVEWDYHISERAYGRFQRVYGLPVDADGNKTKAYFENGVLTIAVPKKPGARKPVKSVPITSRQKPQGRSANKPKAKAK
jgi:HSP20 family protein